MSEWDIHRFPLGFSRGENADGMVVFAFRAGRLVVTWTAHYGRRERNR